MRRHESGRNRAKRCGAHRVVETEKKAGAFPEWQEQSRKIRQPQSWQGQKQKVRQVQSWQEQNKNGKTVPELAET